MNELIWDLFKQSGIDIGEDQESNIEKFAELIVQECARVASGATNDDNEIRAMYVVVTSHFGVE